MNSEPILHSALRNIAYQQETAMEVKIFSSSNPEDVQHDVNQWLQENEVRVQHIGQSQSEKNGRFVFIISLFYQRA